MAVQVIGQVGVFYRGATAPTNTDLIWRDTSVSPNVWKQYNTVTLQWEVLIPDQNLVTTTNTTLEINAPGTYIYTGAGAASWTIVDVASMINGSVVKIKNRSSDQSDLTLTANVSNQIYTSEEKSSLDIFSGDQFIELTAEDYWTL